MKPHEPNPPSTHYSPIITSILDNDLYKCSMQAAVLKLYDDVDVRAEFIARSSMSLPAGFSLALAEQIDHMANLRLTDSEERWLRLNPLLSWLPRSYIDFLRGYRFNPSEVTLNTDDGLSLTIQGPWYSAILWEVPLLAIISELYFKMTGQRANSELFYSNLENKTNNILSSHCSVADFGTRRRYSYDTQKEMLEYATAKKALVGTSNMHFAHMYHLTPIGTHAHEWFQGHMAMFGVTQANKMALGAWLNVFKGKLGTALTDTFTTDVFLRDFDLLMARQFDGCRQDSGDPLEWADKVIKHYELLGIDPRTKTLVFSDALTDQSAAEILNYVAGRAKVAFGIGTFLTNDVGVDPLNIVIKATAFKVNGRWIPVVKLSDSPRKATGRKEIIESARLMLSA